MAITNDNFDQLKIDKLKYFLEDMAQKNQPRPYEIFVDTLKVVPKTEDPIQFESYEYYVNENTEKIRILIYNSNLSPRNDQYCFYLKPLKTNSSLNGLGKMDNVIREKLDARDKEHELNRTKEELTETRKQLGEAETYIETLEKKLDLANDAKYKLKNIDLLDLGAAMLGRLAEKHAGALEQLGLAGLAAPALQAPAIADEKASFSKKRPPAPDTAQHHYTHILQQLESVFAEQDLIVVMDILHRFAQQPEQLKTVADLLDITVK